MFTSQNIHWIPLHSNIPTQWEYISKLRKKEKDIHFSKSNISYRFVVDLTDWLSFFFLKGLEAWKSVSSEQRERERERERATVRPWVSVIDGGGDTVRVMAVVTPWDWVWEWEIGTVRQWEVIVAGERRLWPERETACVRREKRRAWGGKKRERG